MKSTCPTCDCDNATQPCPIHRDCPRCHGMRLMNTCPRCNTDRKYERTETGKYGCTSWWHQFLELPDIWLVAVPTRPVEPPVRTEKTSVMPYGEPDGMGANSMEALVRGPMVGFDVGGMKYVDSD